MMGKTHSELPSPNSASISLALRLKSSILHGGFRPPWIGLPLDSGQSLDASV